MIIEIALAILLGVAAGTITGVIPGIHTNLVAVTLLSLIPFLPSTSTTTLIAFIASMAITHTFLDFIPSIFLGAPDEDTALGVLPGHKFLMKGLGHEAIKLTLIGSSIAIALLVIIIPTFIFTIPKIYPFIQRMMSWFLIWISIFLILDERESKTRAIIIFILAGFLGIATLNLNISQPLFPLLTGLFGSSTLIHSIKTKTKIPKQKITETLISKKELIKPAIATTLISPLCSFFPGLGSSQAAIIGSKITGRLSSEQFLVLLGSINTLVVSVSFLTLFLVDKSRTGVANAVSQLTTLTPGNLITILIAILAASIIAIPLTILISKIFAKNIHKINYSKISLTVLALLTALVFIFSGFIGLFTFAVATVLGLTCIEFGTRRSFLMGALLIPTILFYLPI